MNDLANIWIINMIKINGEIETRAVAEREHAQALFKTLAQTMFGDNYEQLIAQRQLGSEQGPAAFYLTDDEAAISMQRVTLE